MIDELITAQQFWNKKLYMKKKSFIKINQIKVELLCAGICIKPVYV